MSLRRALDELRKWAKENSMTYNGAKYKGYGFATIYPADVKRFWDICDEMDKFCALVYEKP